MSNIRNELCMGSYVLEFPSHEEARYFLSTEDYPISNIIIGLTYPFATYKVQRKSTNKYYLFEYIISGEGKAKIGNKFETLCEGNLLFYDKNDDQYFYSNKNNPLKKIWISFSSEYIDKMIQAYNLKSGVYNINSANLFFDIFEISKSSSIFSQSFYIIADSIHKIITEICSFEKNKNPTLIMQIKNELSKAVYKKINLKEIASNLQMSISTLIRVFKKKCNITPYQYILNEKIKVSKSLLKTTNMSIKEIAYLLCFTDEHYFSYYFKKYNDITPTEYKNK